MRETGERATFTCLSLLGGVVVCRPVGDVDDDGARMHEAFAQCLTRATDTVVLDCTSLGFCDSTALNALLTLRHDAQARGVRLIVAAPGHQLRRLLAVTGASGLFPAHPTLADALSAARSAGRRRRAATPPQDRNLDRPVNPEPEQRA